MVPKDGNLAEVSNWRPIAVLKVLYKVFARLIFNRLAPQLDHLQCADQHAYRKNFSIDDPLYVFEILSSKALEYNVPLWAHCVHKEFQRRGTKQGDVLSTLLFNTALEEVFVNWKRKLTDHGWRLDQSVERLTNLRFADDILLLGKNENELYEMMALLFDELEKAGLELNAKKSKILTTMG
eukprot:8831217-Karenia_brevis.AAC.1